MVVDLLGVIAGEIPIAVMDEVEHGRGVGGGLGVPGQLVIIVEGVVMWR